MVEGKKGKESQFQNQINYSQFYYKAYFETVNLFQCD